VPLRVLVVDDSAYHRRTLARIIGTDPGLELAGTAADGEEAIKKVVTLKPDVVTCDLEMPRMDGFTFLRWLMRTHPRPVLVVSSRESNKSVFRALELGAADFVVKPVSYASERLAAIEEIGRAHV
jgi:two-component system chemotaxis response regulator CheB